MSGANIVTVAVLILAACAYCAWEAYLLGYTEGKDAGAREARAHSDALDSLF